MELSREQFDWSKYMDRMNMSEGQKQYVASLAASLIDLKNGIGPEQAYKMALKYYGNGIDNEELIMQNADVQNGSAAGSGGSRGNRSASGSGSSGGNTYQGDYYYYLDENGQRRLVKK